MDNLSILHFNDVYRVTPQKLQGTKDTIDTTQFAALLDDLRGEWQSRQDGKLDGLVLFSGDVFSPSVESTVTRGSHMVPVMNEISPDVSLVGNHDFDFGYPHLSTLIKDTTFPWLLSNIVDTETSKVPEHLQEFIVLERAGVKIGLIGLVEKEWIGTVSSWPSNFKWRDMAEVGLDLSQRLRDPNGTYKCDIIIALTHSRIPNDIALAKVLKANSPAAQQGLSTHNSHGVDLLLGGHDHIYYVSKGVSSWEDYDTTQVVLGAEEDNGDVLVVKSGTDFRDLSQFTLELQATPDGSIRRKVIHAIRGRRHAVKPGSKSSKKLQDILSKLLSSVSETLKAPVCMTRVPIDVRSEFIRTAESASGNWFADVLRHAYDDALCMKGKGPADGVFICAGTLRGDSVYGPGKITLGDIMEILPFEDPIVVLELDGESIWKALEGALETWPAHEGRFPVVAGLRVTWDSRKPAGKRVLSVGLQKEEEETDQGGEGASNVDGSTAVEEIKCEKGGRKYTILTREYMAQGHDGFLALKGHNYLIDDETGQLMSSLVRKYLLGARYIRMMCQYRSAGKAVSHLHRETSGMISKHQAREGKARQQRSKAAERWENAIHQIRHMQTSADYQAPFSVASREHMTGVDCFDGAEARTGTRSANAGDEPSEGLITVHPIVDGRLHDVGRV